MYSIKSRKVRLWASEMSTKTFLLLRRMYFFVNLDKPRTRLFFRPFLNTLTNIVQNLTIKLGWCTWDSNSGEQYGMRRRIH